MHICNILSPSQRDELSHAGFSIITVKLTRSAVKFPGRYNPKFETALSANYSTLPFSFYFQRIFGISVKVVFRMKQI